jgi:hypothetical protein
MHHPSTRQGNIVGVKRTRCATPLRGRATLCVSMHLETRESQSGWPTDSAHATQGNSKPESRSAFWSKVKVQEQPALITEICNPQERIAAIARDYASNPEKTLIVSPDNTSRRDINQAVRTELQASGALGKENVSFPVLVARNDMTGADRAWGRQVHPRRHRAVHSWQPRAWPEKKHLRHGRRDRSSKQFSYGCQSRRPACRPRSAALARSECLHQPSARVLDPRSHPVHAQ